MSLHNDSLPHALVISFPAQSHLNPMLHTSKMLASLGMRITFAATQDCYQRLRLDLLTHHSQQEEEQQKDLPAHRSRSNFHLVGLQASPPLAAATADAATDPRATGALDIFGIEDAAEKFLQKMEKEGTPVTCVITDIFVSWASRLAKKYALVDVSFCVNPAIAYTAYLHLPRLLDSGVLSFNTADRSEEAKKLLTLLPGMPQLYPSDFPAPMSPAGRDAIFFAMLEDYQSSTKSDWVLVHSISELESSTVDALRNEGIPVLTVGPSIPYSLLGVENAPEITQSPSVWEAEEGCLQWLHSKAPNSVIYVSFGSVIKLSPIQLVEIAMGLEASEQPFLWVIRPDGIGDSESTLEDALPKGFSERTSDRGLVVSWAPQLRVLAHPSVGGIFFQFGWSSSLECICMGVPMVGWPVIADNPVNCRLLVSECKVAMECERREGYVIVEKEEVERVVRAMMQGGEGEGMRRRARELRDVARRAVREGGSTYENLKTFIEDVKKRGK